MNTVEAATKSVAALIGDTLAEATMPCVTSMIVEPGEIRAMTAWHTPTNSSRRPRSETKTTGLLT